MENFFLIHLRHIKLFKDLKILSLSANSTYKTPTLEVEMFSELVFFKLLHKDDIKCKKSSTILQVQIGQSMTEITGTKLPCPEKHLLFF